MNCPNCGQEIEAGGYFCPACGAMTEYNEAYLRSIEERLGVDPGPLPQPPERVLPTACSVCGRADETVRLVEFPFVVGILVMTFRRAFRGVWCRRHRLRKQLKAGLITSTLGWLGFPWGFIWSPWALYHIARGGFQPAEVNTKILAKIAEQKYSSGDARGVIRCFEAAFRLNPVDEIRERLRDLYRYSREPDGEPGRFVPVLLLSFAGLFLLGGLIGLVDQIISYGIYAVTGGETNIFDVLLSWLPLLSMTILSGLALNFLTEGVLSRLKSRHKVFGGTLALVYASLLLYGLPMGRAAGELGRLLVNDPSSIPAGARLLSIFAVFFKGGFYEMVDAIQFQEIVNLLYLAFLAVAAVFFLMLSLGTALDSTGWQLELENIRESMGSLRERKANPGWAAIAILGLGLAGFTALFFSTDVVTYSYPVALNNQALERLEEGNYETAVAILQESLDLRPKYPLAHTNLGWAYYYQGRNDQAITEHQLALSLNPGLEGAHEGLGWAYYQKGDFTRALTEFKQALEIDSDSVDAFEGLGWSYIQAEDPEQAEAAFQRALEINPQAAYLHRALGFSYSLRGDLEAAIQAFQDALAIYPEDSEAEASIGWAHLELGNLEEAENHLKNAQQLAPDDPWVHNGFAQLYYEKESLDLAITHLEKAVQADPSYLGARMDLGWAYAGRGEFDRAADQYHQLAALAPDSGAPHAALALLHYLQGDPEAMEAEIQLAESLGLNDPITYSLLGRVYIYQHNFQVARDYYQTARSLNPENRDDLLSLAEIEAYLGDFESAHLFCDTALVMKPDNVDAILTRSEIYIQQRKLDKALNELEPLLGTAPDKSEIHSQLGWIYLVQNKPEAALQAALEASRINPYNFSAKVIAASAYHELGDNAKAFPIAQEAAEFWPTYDRPHYLLGVIYMRGGETEKAIDELEQFLALYWDRAFAETYKQQAEDYLKALR